MTPIKHEPLFTATLNVGPPQLLGATPNGDRRIVQVQGGSFTGPRLNGTVLAGGGDWIVVRPDASTMLDVRLTLQTDDKALS